jgi:Ricin-type beta-trefoil lectin domain
MNKTRFRLGRYALALAISALTAGSGLLAAGPASASTTAYTPIKNAAPSQLCLDVMSEDGLQNDGARLQIYHCTGVSEQKFRLVPADAGTGPIPGLYEIRPLSSPGKCLVPDENRSAFTGQPVPDGQGAQVVQQSCIFYAQIQNWTFKSTNEIVNQFRHTCLDTTGSGTRDHEHVMIWPCNGNLAQRWIW